MSQERSLDHFVDRLEKRARAARIISIAITIVVVVVGAIVVSVTVWQIRKKIDEAKQELTRVQNEIVGARAVLESARKDADSVKDALNILPASDKNAVLNKAAELKQQDTNTVSATPTVYPQVMDKSQIAQATAVCAKLRKADLKVEDVDAIPTPIPLSKTIVKYFRPEYADEAQKIVDILKQSGVPAAVVPVVNQAGQIEIWFSRDAFPSNSQSSENAALAKAADQVLFEFQEALKRPEDKTEAMNRLQRIVGQLEQDKEASPYVKASRISSKASAGLRDGLMAIRRAVAADKKASLLDRINKIIVDIGQPSYKPKS